MKYLLLLMIFFGTYTLQAQEEGGYEVMPEGTYRYPEKPAQPVNGLEAFYEEFSEKFDFSTLSDPNITEAKCKLEFFVEKDGSLTQVNVTMASYGADKEALSLLKSMPKWKPAMENGEIVRSKYELNLKIKKPVN